jgi:excisionase family DNA binding protein
MKYTVSMAMKDWLTEAEAMQELQRSRATLRRLDAARQIETTLQRQPGKLHKVKMYRAADVSRLADNEDEYDAAAKEASAKSLVPVATKQVAAILEATASSRQPKLFLTLDQAAEYSGLDRELIKRLIEQGHLKRVPLTVHWLIARAALDAFADSLK